MSSRWTNTPNDDALDAKIKAQKEEKKRLKAEKARKLKQSQAAAAAADSSRREQEQQHLDERPQKRRKTTPEPDTTTRTKDFPVKLLRFETPGWSRSRSIENYDKLNDIEEGTYGWVARATERATGKIVALKRLKVDSRDRSGVPVTGLREIQILKDCKHRNIVSLEEVVIGDDRSRPDNPIFLVLEFVEHDLKTILEDMPEPFLSSEVKQLLLQLTSGLAYLHSNYIIHRDLKTSNILLNNRGQLKIADFGMARYISSPPPSNLTHLVVTLWYRSPELLLGARTYSISIDMWSVGCIFAELLTREPLLPGTNEADQITRIFALCGLPTEQSWPAFRRLPNARSLRLPPPPASYPSLTSTIHSRFPALTTAGAALLADLLSLDPDRRPSTSQMLQHEYFRQDPKPKPESMFPTFPSKAGQEKRRRHEEPHAPTRGQDAASLGDADFTSIFQGREKEAKGAGFALRMG